MVMSSCVHNAVSTTSADKPLPCTLDDRCVSGPGELDGVVSVVVMSAAVATAIAYTVYHRMHD